MGAGRGRGDLYELDDLDGALLVEVEMARLGVLVHEGRGGGRVEGGDGGLEEHGRRWGAVGRGAAGGAGGEGGRPMGGRDYMEC